MDKQFHWEPPIINLTDEQVEQVREAWQTDFGEVMTRDFARQRGTETAMLYRMLHDFLLWGYARAAESGVSHEEYMKEREDLGEEGTSGM